MLLKVKTLILISILVFISCSRNNSSEPDGYDMVKINYSIVSLVDFYRDPITDSHYIPADVENYNHFLKDSVDTYTALDYLYPMLRYKPEETFNYTFEESNLKFHLSVDKTSDNRLKFYKYNERLMSTTLIQYKDSLGRVYVDIYNPQYPTGNEVLASYQRRNACSDEDCPGISSGITTSVDEIETVDGNTIYLTVQYCSTGMAREKNVYVSAIGFVEGRPQRLNILENGDSVLSTINIYLMTYHSENWKNHDKLFKFDSDTQNLYIPFIEDDEFNDKFIVYHFNGRKFVNQGVE